MDYTPEQITALTNSIIKLVLLVVFIIIIYYYRCPLGNFLKNLVKISLKALGMEASAEFQKSSPEQEQVGANEEPFKEQQVEPDDEEETVLEEKSDKNPSTKKEWEREMFECALFEKLDKAEKAYNKALTLSLSKKDKSLLTIKYAEYKFRFLSDEKAFSIIEGFTDSKSYDKEVAKEAFSALARSRLFLKDYKRAAELFEKAKEQSTDEEDNCYYNCRIAFSLYEFGRKDEAFVLLEDALIKFKEFIFQSKIYEQIAELYEKEGDHELRALAIEKAIELGKEENQKYFSAGHAYSNSGFDKLALLHYQKALKLGSGAGSLNNLGVQYEQLGMPISSISKYQSAFDKGETLSVANMAYRLIDAGFIDKAKDVLKQAQEKENVHQNVNSALASISQKIEEEEKKETEIIKEANKQRLYFQQYAKYYFTKAIVPEIKVDYYQNKETNIKVSVTNGSIIGTWGQKGLSPDVEWARKFEGTLHNNAAAITFYEEDIMVSYHAGETKYHKDTDGYLYIESGKLIKILKRDKYHKQDFEEIFLVVKNEGDGDKGREK